VSKTREKERVRPTPFRAIIQSSIGEASGSDTGSDTIEDIHPLSNQVTHLNDYWLSERDTGFSGASQPPTTAFSPAQLFALAESSTTGSDDLYQSRQSSVTSPEPSSSQPEHKDFSRVAIASRPRRARFQRGCRTCRSVTGSKPPAHLQVYVTLLNHQLEFRRRHVKCDEARPACVRCLRSYGSCEGYPTDGTGVHAFDSNIPTTSTIGGSEQPAAGPTFTDETEALYFRLFLEETSLELIGVFDTSFWGRILLQESHQQDFVRHALVGIAALSKSIKTKALTVAYPGTFGTIWQEEATKQKEYALTHFGKSLKGMKAVPWVGEDYLRKISIAILLVIVFETMYGQPDLAFAHAMIGDRLIRRRIDIRDRARVRINGQLSPAPRVLDGDIFSAFVRFGLQMMTFVDIRPHVTHEIGRVNASDTMAKMPSEFFSLVEATYFWEYVVRRSFHYVMWAAVLSQSNKLARDFTQPFSGRVLDMTPETCIYGSPYIVPSELHAAKDYHAVEIGLWWSAFVPLLTHIQSSSSDLRARTGALMMQLYAITTRIVVEGTLFTEECAYDIFLPEFKKILNLSSQIDDNFREMSEHQPSFHVHLSIVPPLFTTLLRCRDRGVRRQCIEILRTSQHDGPWDRFVIAKVGSWIMELEEAGSVSGFIPEHARVQFSRGMRSMESQLVMVQVVRRDRSPGWEMREPSLAWEEMSMNAHSHLAWIGRAA